ncbi:hypothetical protein V1506DRAFT_510304 [Lipomyces tetrasporus]
MSSENGLGTHFRGLFDPDRLPLDQADLIFYSTPVKCEKILDGLSKAGFNLDYGYDDSEFLMNYAVLATATSTSNKDVAIGRDLEHHVERWRISRVRVP